MTCERRYGKREGLAERLLEWRRALGESKKYPWIGLGICDDLVAAAEALGADTSEFTPNHRKYDL